MKWRSRIDTIDPRERMVSLSCTRRTKASVLQRSGRGFRSVAILRYNKGRVPSMVPSQPWGRFNPYYYYSPETLGVLQYVLFQRRSPTVPPWRVRSPSSSRTHAIRNLRFFFTSLRIRAHSRPAGSGDLNDSRFIHAHCLPERRDVTDVKDAAFRNSCREKEEKEKESVAISWVHGCIVDAQPPIRNYSQILKSNMAVSSCQSGIAHTNPKSRFTVSRGGPMRFAARMTGLARLTAL